MLQINSFNVNVRQRSDVNNDVIEATSCVIISEIDKIIFKNKILNFFSLFFFLRAIPMQSLNVALQNVSKIN